ncbi:hypothetical protein B0G77_6149 [Paraburkholderia sp. BL10I2N1]|nr:hypothetical protein B0G77_6149 [Paraburkholderia sp. BL10I2N1]
MHDFLKQGIMMRGMGKALLYKSAKCLMVD